MPYGGQAPTTSGRAVAVMVLGIAGLATAWLWIGLIPAIVGLSLAPAAKREIRDSRGWRTGGGMVTAGVICGWIAIGLVALITILVIIAAIVDAASSSRYHRY